MKKIPVAHFLGLSFVAIFFVQFMFNVSATDGLISYAEIGATSTVNGFPSKTSDQKATTKKKVTPAKKTEKTKKTEKKVTRPQGAKKEEPQKVMRGVAEEVKKEEKSQPPEEKSENKTVQEAAVQTTLPSKEEEHFTASVETGKQILQLLDTIVTATKVPPSCPVVYVYTREQTPQQPAQQATENTQTTQQAPQAPAPSILNDLVVYYDFEVENNGLLTDMSGTGNQGRILGAQMTEGKKGRGLSFDGDDYVLLDKGRNLDITDTITIASWLKFEGTSGDARFVYKRSGNNGVFLQSPKNAADRIEFGFGDSAGNMFGAVEFYTKAKAAQIKPIIGIEAYVAPGSRFDRTKTSISDAAFHLILLAENNAGYRNLLKLAQGPDKYSIVPGVMCDLPSHFIFPCIRLSGLFVFDYLYACHKPLVPDIANMSKTAYVF